MIPKDKLILLDTNILIYLVRGSAFGQSIDDKYQLRSRSDRPLFSVVTAGETLALAKRLNWGQKKVDRLMELLRELVMVDINSSTVLNKYAEIDHYLKSIGHPIGQNDTWIAATAAAVDACLLTSDKDFDPLNGKFIQLERIDLSSSF